MLNCKNKIYHGTIFKIIKSELGITIYTINDPIPYIGFSCLMTAESQWQNSLLWTTKFKEVHGTNLMNLPGMKDWDHL